MATKNDGGPAGRKSSPGRKKPATSQSQPQQPSGSTGDASQAAAASDEPAQPATPPSSNPATIHKGVYLSALIYVEGDQAPAGDFNSLTTSTLKKIFGEFFSAPHDGLTFILKSVNVKNNVQDEDLEEKFQF